MEKGQEAQGNWRDAVKEVGEIVMYQVTTKLYQGGNLRPDVYYKRTAHDGECGYTKRFNASQRALLKSYFNPENYDINLAARGFDISLHWVVQQHLCGLSPKESLYRKLWKIVQKRNNVCHALANTSMSVDDLNGKLEELHSLCFDILDELNERTGHSLHQTELDIEKCIKQKKLKKWDPFYPSTTRPQSFTDSYMRPHQVKKQENEEIGMLGSLAISVAVGLGVALVGGVIANSVEENAEKIKRESKRYETSSDQECVVM